MASYRWRLPMTSYRWRPTDGVLPMASYRWRPTDGVLPMRSYRSPPTTIALSFLYLGTATTLRRTRTASSVRFPLPWTAVVNDVSMTFPHGSTWLFVRPLDSSRGPVLMSCAESDACSCGKGSWLLSLSARFLESEIHHGHRGLVSRTSPA
jgi:hypothetical protein